MRLIDADELKKELAKNITIWTFNVSHDGILAEIIDNVTTVEMPKALGTVDENGNIKIELLRPQGEWKFKKFDEKTGIPNSDWCPFCGMVKAQVYDNFCGNCGADMRGEKP